MKFVHIDFDVVRYRAGFAAETGFWRAIKLDEQGDPLEISERVAFKSQLYEIYPKDEWEYIYDPEPEPLPNCLHSVKLVANEIVETLGLTWQRARGYLSTPGETFRHRIATLKPYKGNRDPSHKPYWFTQIAEYLEQNYPVVWSTEGYEADDDIAIQHLKFGKDSCIATIDKDLDTIPGRHYNFVHKEKYIISPIQAIKNFWTQVLVGDSADNVGGCPGIGKVKAEKLLAGLAHNAEMADVVAEAYENAYGGDLGMFNLVENARLLWILRAPGDTPPLPYDWGEKYRRADEECDA